LKPVERTGDVWLSAKEAVAQRLLSALLKMLRLLKETKVLFKRAVLDIPQFTNHTKPLIWIKILALILRTSRGRL
jgi:hypothetical protein